MEIERHPFPVVGTLIVNQKGEVLLVKFEKNDSFYHIPGGKIRWGETIENAVKREVKEEVSLDVELETVLYVDEALFSKELTKREDKHFIFLECVCKSASSEVEIDGKEIADYIWASPQEALKLNLNSFTRRFIEKYMEMV